LGLGILVGILVDILLTNMSSIPSSIAILLAKMSSIPSSIAVVYPVV
jgi:hypothetical protein